MLRLTRKDWYASLLVILIGLATILEGQGYGLGTLSRMGPGYYPVLLGGLLMFVGLLLLVAPEVMASDATEDKKTDWMERSRPWLMVALSMIVFMAVGKYGGFVPATFLLIVIASLGDKANSIKLALLLATGVTAVSVVVFSYLLQMQFPLFTWG